MSTAGTRLVDKLKLVAALPPQTPSSASPDYANLANYNHLTVVVTYKNATTVTGAAIALLQATDTAGTSAKTLAFVDSWVDTDDAGQSAGDALTYTAVASNTLTLDNTDSKGGQVVLEVDATSLDVANGFRAVKVTVGNATAQVVAVEYILSGARFAGGLATLPSAL